LRSELATKYNIMIAGGLSELRGKIIRIGSMGTSAALSNVSITLNAIGSILRETRKEGRMNE